MKLDIGKYRGAKAALMKMYSNMQEKDIIRRMGSVAVATHTPVICIHAFVLEEFGPSEEIQGSMERLIKFYGITEVIK